MGEHELCVQAGTGSHGKGVDLRTLFYGFYASKVDSF